VTGQDKDPPGTGPAPEPAEPAAGAGPAGENRPAGKDGPAGGGSEPARKNGPAGGGSGSGARKPDSIVAQVVGTTSFFGALLLYMGWNYEDQLLQQFQIPAPQSIGLGTVDFAAAGIQPLFNSNAAFILAVLVMLIMIAAAIAGRLPEDKRDKLADLGKTPAKLFWSGVVLTAVTLTLTWPQVSSGGFVDWLSSNVDAVYPALALLAGGVLLMAWPARRSTAGQVAYPLALVVVAILALWGGGVYAGTLGYQHALSIENDIAGQTAVAVYSAQPLDLSGPSVSCALRQRGSGYPYECTGLRLLTIQSGTYYLLPLGWAYDDERTYILDDSDQIRVELYCIRASKTRACNT